MTTFPLQKGWWPCPVAYPFPYPVARVPLASCAIPCSKACGVTSSRRCSICGVGADARLTPSAGWVLDFVATLTSSEVANGETWTQAEIGR